MIKIPNKYGLITGAALGAFSFIAPANAQSQPAELQQDFESFTNEVGQARATSAAFLDTGIENGGRISAIAGEVEFGPGVLIFPQQISGFLINAPPPRFTSDFENLDNDAIADNTVISEQNSSSLFVFPLAFDGLGIPFFSNTLEDRVIEAISEADFNPTQANALVRNFQNNRSNQQARITGAGFLDTGEELGGGISATAGEIELAPGQQIVLEIVDGIINPVKAQIGLEFEGDSAEVNTALNEVNLEIAEGEVRETNPLEEAVTEVIGEQDLSSVQVNALVDAFGGGNSSEDLALD